MNWRKIFLLQAAFILDSIGKATRSPELAELAQKLRDVDVPLLDGGGYRLMYVTPCEDGYDRVKLSGHWQNTPGLAQQIALLGIDPEDEYPKVSLIFEHRLDVRAYVEPIKVRKYTVRSVYTSSPETFEVSR